MSIPEHQKIKETAREGLFRMMKEAELDIKTVIKARNAVRAVLPGGEKAKKRNEQRANSLIGRLFAGSFVDGEIHSADVIKRLADTKLIDPVKPCSTYNWSMSGADMPVRRLGKPSDSFFTTRGAQAIRIVGKQYAELLFD